MVPASASSCSRSIGRAGAVVLAHRGHELGVVELRAVGGDDGVRVAVVAGLHADPLGGDPEAVRVGDDQPLGQRRGLGEERPVPVAEGERRVRARPDLAGRDDVEHRQPRDDARDGRAPSGRRRGRRGRGRRRRRSRARAAAIAATRSPASARLLCARVVVADGRAEGVAVARQVGRDDGEALGEPRRDRVPHQVRLGIAVQQQQRRPRSADPRADGPARRLEVT